MIPHVLTIGAGRPSYSPESRFSSVRTSARATPPQVLLLLSIVSMQIGAAVATQLFARLGTTGTVFFRLAFSAAVLVAVVRPRLSRQVWRHAHVFALYGLTIVVMNWSFYQAIARIPLGVAVAVEFVGPLLIGVCTSRRPRDLIWLTMAAVGIVIFGREASGALDRAGLLFALLGSAGWGSYILASQRVGKVVPGHSGLALALVVGSAVLAPFYLVSDPPHALTWIAVLAAFGVAMLSTALPLSLEFAALQRISARTYGVLVTLEPVVAGLVGFVLLGQPLDAWSVVAVVLVTGASLGVTLLE